MEVSPFRYQGPLSADEVQGRDELVADLVARVTERRVTALLGPRRYGKTSVLRAVAAEMPEVATVWVDLYEVTSMADVSVRFDEAISAATGSFGVAAQGLAGALSLNLGAVKIELSKPPRSRPDPSLYLKLVLDVLIGAATRSPTLLVLDEFSSIGRAPGAAGALRTALQNHYDDLGILFAGSHPSMMRTLFTHRAEPFYSQADLVEIGPLTKESIHAIVADGFASTGRGAGVVGSYINEFCQGHPQRSMQLADACWRQTAEGQTADLEVWSQGLAGVRAATSEGMERLYSHFEGGERSVLRAVARSGSVYGTEAALLDLSTGAAGHARRTLLDSGDIVQAEDGLRVVDPLFADWLRRRFPI